MDGAPLANGTVTFTSSQGQTSFATTDGEGKYELIYRGNAKGAKGGLQTVLCDGSTRFISENIDMLLYRAIRSREGNEVVGEF